MHNTGEGNSKTENRGKFMNQNITIREITEINSFESLRKEWDSLLASSSTQDAFLTWEWFYAWLKSYGKDAHIRIFTAWDNETLVGAAPFMMIQQRKIGLRFQVLRTLSAPECDASGFLLKDGDTSTLQALLEYIVTQSTGWNVLEFNRYALNNLETREILGNLKRHGFDLHEIPHKHFYVPYTSIGSWDKYFKEINSNFRRKLKKTEQGMATLGGFSVKRFKGKDVTWGTIQAIIEVNRHSSFPNICDSEQDQTLHKELIDVMADKGWMDVYILFINNLPAAYLYGFLYNNSMGYWRVGYDRRTDSNVAIGVYLLSQVIKSGFDENQKELDFLRGDEDYKNRWTDSHRDYVNFKAVPANRILARLAFNWAPKINATLKGWFKRNHD